jgi:hypothetical protein
MTEFYMCIAIVIAFGASSRVCGLDTVAYESKQEASVTIVEQYDPHCD